MAMLPKVTARMRTGESPQRSQYRGPTFQRSSEGPTVELAGVSAVRASFPRASAMRVAKDARPMKLRSTTNPFRLSWTVILCRIDPSVCNQSNAKKRTNPFPKEGRGREGQVPLPV